MQENQNYLLSSSIVNPNLLEIDGPAVSLVFKQAKAKAIFEYLAEVGNYGFVWVKNSPNKDNDVDNQRLISMTLKDVSYKKAFKIRPNHPETSNNMGVIFHELKKYDEAEFYLKKSLMLSPEYAEAHYNLGNTFKEKNNPPRQ